MRVGDAAAALLPVLVLSPEGRPRARGRHALVWANPRYGRLLTEAAGARYHYYEGRGSGLALVPLRVVEAVLAAARQGRLGRLLSSRVDLAVRAFAAYRGRYAHDPDVIRERMRRLLGPRRASRLLRALRRALAGRGWSGRPRREWLRMLLRRNWRGYGYWKKIHGCVREHLDYAEREGLNYSYYELLDRCRMIFNEYVRGRPW